MKNSIIILDGVSNSGKTTICTKLAEDKNNILVEECPDFVKSHPELFNNKGLPGFPTNSIEECKVQAFLLEVEIERLKQAFYIIKTGRNAILDRSFLSTLSVAYSLDNKENFTGVLKNAIKLFREYLDFIDELKVDSNIKYIFLTTSPEVVRKRNVTREKRLKECWIDEKLMQLQNNFFIGQQHNCKAKIIDTSHLSKEEVSINIFDEIQKRGEINDRFTLSL